MLVSLKKHPQSSLDIGRSATDLIRYAIWLPLAANAVACLGVAGATKPLAPTARSARATPRNIFRVLGRLVVPARPQRTYSDSLNVNASYSNPERGAPTAY